MTTCEPASTIRCGCLVLTWAVDPSDHPGATVVQGAHRRGVILTAQILRSPVRHTAVDGTDSRSEWGRDACMRTCEINWRIDMFRFRTDRRRRRPSRRLSGGDCPAVLRSGPISAQCLPLAFLSPIRFATGNQVRCLTAKGKEYRFRHLPPLLCKLSYRHAFEALPVRGKD
jgi:hypothetical protein